MKLTHPCFTEEEVYTLEWTYAFSAYAHHTQEHGGKGDSRRAAVPDGTCASGSSGDCPDALNAALLDMERRS